MEEGNTQKKNNIPDLRNCLYWNPKYTITDISNSKIEFYTSDNTGEYNCFDSKAK